MHDISPASSRFRLRRRSFPRIRSRHAPHGFVDEIGWLTRDTLWIDGWLTLPPTPTLELDLELGGTRIRRTATCLQGPPFVDSPQVSARRWILLLPVDEEQVTASRVRNVSLCTETGTFLWLGGFDRLISPDVVRHLGETYIPRELLEDLESHLAGDRPFDELPGVTDPILHRNVEALRRCLDPTAPTSLEGRAPAGSRVKRVDVIGHPPVDPDVSLIFTLLVPPDLLEHHLVHVERSRGSADWDLLFVISPLCQTPELVQRFAALAELYRISARILYVEGETSWAASAVLGAEHARAEHLIFLHGHTLSFEPGGLASLVEGLQEEESVSVTTPVVQSFDGAVRSAGVQFQRQEGSTQGLEIRPLSANWSPGQIEGGIIDGCGSDCLATTRSLFLELDGFPNIFNRPDYETIDYCLRVAARGGTVRRVPSLFTRFIESSSPPALTIDIPSDAYDLVLLDRRRRRYETAGFGIPETPDSDRPLVSVIVPTLNPGSDLTTLLDALEAQEDAPTFEVFVIDSSSRDGTIRRLKKRAVRHVVIDRKDFNHGLTRNRGVREARGEIVAFLSQDALPSPGWLAGLVEAFQDPMVVGAYSRQVPRPDASPAVRAQLSRWPATFREPRRQEIPHPGLFARLPLEDQLRLLCFDNVSSAVRRRVALSIPFRDLPFGEDRDWAYRVMAAGYVLQYCPASEVVHSHERSAWYALRRTFMDHRLIQDLLGTNQEVPWVASLDALRRESSFLSRSAAEGSSWWGRLRGRGSAPFRALAGIVGAQLGRSSVHNVASGSRAWRLVTRLLARRI